VLALSVNWAAACRPAHPREIERSIAAGHGESQAILAKALEARRSR